MLVSIAFLTCILAGFINGSYAFPIKYMSALKKETIWFYFSFVAFLIMPATSILLLDHHAFSIFEHIQPKVLASLSVGGFIFGVGMVLFTLCLNKIGIGIAFILNISLGTIGGSLLPLFIFHPRLLLTPFGYTNILAFMFFIIAILLTTYGVHLRDKIKQSKNLKIKNTLVGFLMGVMSGLFCSMQGFVFAYSLPFFKVMATTAITSEYIAINLPWLIIFAFAFIPYVLFQLYLQLRSKSLINIFKVSYLHCIGGIFLMGALYFLSILIYSKSVQNLGIYGQIIAWPLFMIFIILSSNFWSFVQGEWKGSPKLSKIIFLNGLLFMIFAIVMLGYAASILS